MATKTKNVVKKRIEALTAFAEMLEQAESTVEAVGLPWLIYVSMHDAGAARSNLEDEDLSGDCINDHILMWLKKSRVACAECIALMKSKKGFLSKKFDLMLRQGMTAAEAIFAACSIEKENNKSKKKKDKENCWRKKSLSKETLAILRSTFGKEVDLSNSSYWKAVIGCRSDVAVDLGKRLTDEMEEFVEEDDKFEER